MISQDLDQIRRSTVHYKPAHTFTTLCDRVKQLGFTPDLTLSHETVGKIYVVSVERYSPIAISGPKVTITFDKHRGTLSIIRPATNEESLPV